MYTAQFREKLTVLTSLFSVAYLKDIKDNQMKLGILWEGNEWTWSFERMDSSNYICTSNFFQSHKNEWK